MYQVLASLFLVYAWSETSKRARAFVDPGDVVYNRLNGGRPFLFGHDCVNQDSDGRTDSWWAKAGDDGWIDSFPPDPFQERRRFAGHDLERTPTPRSASRICRRVKTTHSTISGIDFIRYRTSRSLMLWLCSTVPRRRWPARNAAKLETKDFDRDGLEASTWPT